MENFHQLQKFPRLRAPIFAPHRETESFSGAWQKWGTCGNVTWLMCPMFNFSNPSALAFFHVVAARHLVLVCFVTWESETRDFNCGCFGMLPRPLYFPYQSSYSRRRPRNRRSSRRPKPEYERNIVSAFFALAAAVLLAIAEAEPKWLHIVSGKCEGKYIGMYKVIAYKHPEDLSKFNVSISCFRSLSYANWPK